MVEGTSNVGEFVSVNTYMMNLFTPLYFLGTVYNIIIQVTEEGRGCVRENESVEVYFEVCSQPHVGRHLISFKLSLSARPGWCFEDFLRTWRFV